MARVLFVDDDTELCSLLVRFFRGSDIEIAFSHDGRTGLRRALEGSQDAIVLDVMLPVLNGFEVLRQIRRRSSIPVLMLTARTEHADRMLGFHIGADDYLSKPFHPEELAARCKALVRRSKAPASITPAAEILQLGELKLDSSARKVWTNGIAVEVTSMEFEIIDLLARGAGRVVGRDEIWAALHQREPSPLERALDTHISNLRKKICANGKVKIRTVRNAGYILVLPE